MDDRRFFVVHSWMMTKLGLKSLERDVFAIIYGFSQNEDGRCYDSLSHLALLTGYSRRAVIDAINSLQMKSYIIKSQENVGGVLKNRYQHNETLIAQILSGEIISPVSEPTSPADEFSGEVSSPVSEVSSPHINIIEKEDNKNKNIETPVSPAPPKNHQRLYNEERKTLSDDLESGKEIDSQKKERKRLSVEEKCLAEIEKRDFSVYVKEALKEYFDWNYHSSNPKKVKQLLDWRQKLDRLEQLIKKGEDGVKVVNQAFSNGWYGFFEYKEDVKTEAHETFTDSINPDNLSLEERQAIYDESKRLVAEGKMKVY